MIKIKNSNKNPHLHQNPSTLQLLKDVPWQIYNTRQWQITATTTIIPTLIKSTPQHRIQRSANSLKFYRPPSPPANAAHRRLGRRSRTASSTAASSRPSGSATQCATTAIDRSACIHSRPEIL